MKFQCPECREKFDSLGYTKHEEIIEGTETYGTVDTNELHCDEEIYNICKENGIEPESKLVEIHYECPECDFGTNKLSDFRKVEK